ncbi:MAG: MoaD/ThiS family protein [Burkholderiaceae bacterium]
MITSTLGRQFAQGQTRFEIAAANVRELLKILDQRFPGLGTEIDRAQGLAIDGEFIQDPLAQPLPDNAEVFVLPKIAGG